MDTPTDADEDAPAPAPTGGDAVRDHALSLPGAWPDEPWEGDTVAKVGAKIFCFLRADAVTVKCGTGREEADEWLARYPDDASVSAYIGRHGWNVLRVGGAIPLEEIFEAIDESHARIVATLPKRERPPA